MKTFRRALQDARFSITAEIPLPGQAGTDHFFAQAGALTESVDAVQFAGSPGAGVPVSPLVLSSLLIRQGIDPIPRLDCRDRNRIALQSDLLGLRALGVSSVILNQGSPLPDGFENPAKPVFDIRGHELIAMANAINEEEWPGGDHEFVIGTETAVDEPDSGWSADTLLARAGAGARFLQTRPCSDLDLLRRYIRQLVEDRITWHYSVIVSLDLAPGRDGADSCAGTMRDVASIPGVSGINLLAAGRPEDLIPVIAASGL